MQSHGYNLQPYSLQSVYVMDCVRLIYSCSALITLALIFDEY